MKIISAFVLMFSAVLAFLILQDLDKQPTSGETSAVWIRQIDGSANGRRTVRMVTAFARDNGVSIAREQDDVRDPDRLRHLYIAAGDPAGAQASWLTEGFPAFGHLVRTQTHPMTDLRFPDPRGIYYVYGGRPGVEEALKAEFAKIGLGGQLVPPRTIGWQVLRFAAKPLGLMFAVVAIGVTLTAGASVLLSAKQYGVLRLQGMSRTRIVRRDLRRIGPSWLFCATAVAAVTLTCLWFYNGFARLGLFALTVGGLAGSLCLLMVLAHLGALALVARTQLLRGLKGEVPAGLTLTSLYVVRIAAAMVVLVTGGITATAWQETARLQESRQAFATLGNTFPGAAYISLTGSRTPEGGDEMSVQVGRWLRKADKRGEIIVVQPEQLQESTSPGVWAPKRDLLVVNDTFLAMQPIVDPAGKRYGPDPEGRVRVIVPEGLRAYADDIAKNVPTIVNPIQQGAQVSKAGVDQVWAKDNQTVFGFGAGVFEKNKAVLRDPVMVAIPNGASFYTDDTYGSLATQDGIIFKDSRDVVAALGREVPEEHIYGIVSVVQQARSELAQAWDELWLRLLTLAAGLAVLVVSGIGVCVIHARKNAQAMFAKHISGWNFVAIHRRLLILDGAVALALLAWVGWELWDRASVIAQYTALGSPAPPSIPPVSPVEVLPAAAVAALATTMLVVVLAVVHHRVITNHAADR